MDNTNTFENTLDRFLAKKRITLQRQKYNNLNSQQKVLSWYSVKILVFLILLISTEPSAFSFALICFDTPICTNSSCHCPTPGGEILKVSKYIIPFHRVLDVWNVCCTCWRLGTGGRLECPWTQIDSWYQCLAKGILHCWKHVSHFCCLQHEQR